MVNSVESADSFIIKSLSGKSYVGETYGYAKEQGGSIFREFNSLDVNKDGVLSEKEIIEPRNQQAKIWNIVSKGFALMAMLTCTVGLLFNKLDNKMLNFTEILGTDTDIKKLILKNALIRGGVSLFAMHKCNKINKETKEMYQSAKEQTRDFSEEKKAG